RRIGEGRAGGGGRQSGDVDVVLDRDRHAEKRSIGERAIAVAFGGERLRFGERVRFRAQRDEDRGIVVRADARGGARDGGFGARRCLARGRARGPVSAPPPLAPRSPEGPGAGGGGLGGGGGAPPAPPPPPGGGGGGGGGAEGGGGGGGEHQRPRLMAGRAGRC